MTPTFAATYYQVLLSMSIPIISGAAAVRWLTEIGPQKDFMLHLLAESISKSQFLVEILRINICVPREVEECGLSLRCCDCEVRMGTGTRKHEDRRNSPPPPPPAQHHRCQDPIFWFENMSPDVIYWGLMCWVGANCRGYLHTPGTMCGGGGGWVIWLTRNW